MSDDLDRKIALSIEKEPTSYDQTTPCFSPLRAWYRKSGPGKEPTWWQPRSFLEPEMTLLLLERMLGKQDWSFRLESVRNDFNYAEIEIAKRDEDGGVRRGSIWQFPIAELPEKVRLAYARAEGLE